MKAKYSFASLLVALMLLSITACTTTMSADFFLDNGEAVRVTLDATDGSSLSFDRDADTFLIQKDGKSLLEGGFFTNGQFDEYAENVISAGADVLRAEPEDDPTLYVFRYDGTEAREYVFLQKIEGSDVTSVSLYAQNVVYKEIDGVFNHIHFERVE